MIHLSLSGNIVRVDGKVLRKFVLSDSYKWLTLNEVTNKVDNIAKGLVKFGVKKGDKVIIWADTRLEWLLSSLALVRISAILTTLFSNLGMDKNVKECQRSNCLTLIRNTWSDIWHKPDRGRDHNNNF